MVNFPKHQSHKLPAGPRTKHLEPAGAAREAWVQQSCVCTTAGGLTSSSQQIAAIGINNLRREMCLSLLLRQSSSKAAVQAGSQPLVSASVCTALLNSWGRRDVWSWADGPAAGLTSAVSACEGRWTGQAAVPFRSVVVS